MADEHVPRPGESWQEYGQRMQELGRASAEPDQPSEPTFEGVIGGTVPKVDHAPETRDDATALGRMFAEYRAEVAALRRELQAHRPGRVTVQEPTETPEQRRDQRLAAIADASHYCPACGTLGKYPQKCSGDPAAGHAPIEMVSTEELGGDPERHTRAPSTDPDHPDMVAA